MGKFLKNCLIISLICIVLGIALSGAGIFNGGLPELKEEVLNGEWSISKEAIEPFFKLEESDYFDKGQILNVDMENLENEFAASGVKEIQMKCAGISVEVTEHEGDNFIVNANKIHQYQVYEENGTIYIAARNKNMQTVNGTIQISIPTAVLDEGMLEVNVEAAACGIAFERLTAKEVALEISAGTMTWTELSAGDLSISMAAGTIEGDNTKVLEETDLSMNAGTISLQGVLGTETDVKITAGTVDILLADSYTDYNYEMNCTGGSVSIGEQMSEGIAKTLEIDNHAAKDMKIACSVGAVAIDFMN